VSFTRAELATATRMGALVGSWIGTAGLATYAVLHYASQGLIGGDAHAYWLAGRSSAPYLQAPGHADAFEYSPVFIQGVRPLSHLSFPTFYACWAGAELIAFWWMTKGLAWRWRVPVLLSCVPELCLANVNAFFGIVLVAGVRLPELWAFVALTKITPSAVGLVWMLLRGDFRGVVRGFIAIAVLAGGSYAFEPQLWSEWFQFLRHHAPGSSLDITVRLALSLILVAALARFNLRWLLPVPFILATPVFVFGFSTNQCLAMLPPTLGVWVRQRSESSGKGRGSGKGALAGVTGDGEEVPHPQPLQAKTHQNPTDQDQNAQPREP